MWQCCVCIFDIPCFAIFFSGDQFKPDNIVLPTPDEDETPLEQHRYKENLLLTVLRLFSNHEIVFDVFSVIKKKIKPRS